LGLKLIGSTGNRDATGALIRWRAGGVMHSRLKTAGGSFMSSHDRREVLGLGSAPKADWVEVRWPRPSTRVDRFVDVPVNQYVTVVEGRGVEK